MQGGDPRGQIGRPQEKLRRLVLEADLGQTVRCVRSQVQLVEGWLRGEPGGEQRGPVPSAFMHEADERDRSCDLHIPNATDSRELRERDSTIAGETNEVGLHKPIRRFQAQPLTMGAYKDVVCASEMSVDLPVEANAGNLADLRARYGQQADRARYGQQADEEGCAESRREATRDEEGASLP